MRQWTRHTRWWLAASALALVGCEAGRDVVRVTDRIIAAGAGTAPKSPMHNVIPSRPAAVVHQITVQDERYLGDIARQLGVTVDGVLNDNKLTESSLKPGQVLDVRTSRDLVDAFEARRGRRIIAQRAAVEAKRVAKIKALADARAERKAKQRLAKLARHGKGAQVAKAPIKGKASVSTKLVAPSARSKAVAHKP
jgi:LysM repeat protein